MAAYKKNTKNGSKLWLVENIHGGWLFQYRPTRSEVLNLTSDVDSEVFSIRFKEIERKKLFTCHGSARTGRKKVG